MTSCIRLWWTLFISLLVLSSPSPAAAPALEQIVTQRQGDSITLSLRFVQPIDADQVSSFTSLNPPRLIVDFPHAPHAPDLIDASTAGGVLGHLALASDGQRSRLLVELTQAAHTSWRVDGKLLHITLRPQDQAAPGPDSPGTIGAIGAINFTRGDDGAGRLAIELPSPHTRVRLRQTGQQLVVDIDGAQLPAALQQRLDLASHGTPITRTTALRHDGGTRLVVDTQGTWRYQAFQRARQLTLELFPDTDTPTPPLTAQRQYQGARLSMNFHDIEVRAALQLLAEFTSTNIIAADSVAGRLSLRLQDLPWDQVLEIILQSRGLAMRRHGEVLWIAPRDELLARERLEREQQSAIDELAPLQTRAYQLNYQRADQLRKMLGLSESKNTSTGAGARPRGMLSRRGSAMVDTRTNQLFVTDTQAVLANIDKLLARIDVAARQVLIEARIVEADDSFGRELGVRLGLAVAGERLALGNSREAVRQASGQDMPKPDNPVGPAVALPAQAISGHVPGSFGLTLFNAAARRFLNVELSALETDGRGRVVASPRVVTADQQTALIEQGEEIPYQQSIGSGASATAFKKANLKLEVTPQITPDGNVILDVDVNKDSRGAATPSGLAINTKHVRTQVRVEDGGTVVIGGIYTLNEAEHESRVPLLGDIPVLGALFRHRSRVQQKTELLIFLTPRVVGG